MIELPNPFAGESGVMYLLEPPDADTQLVCAQILSDTYDKPFVVDDGNSRSLYFTRDFTQSSMSIDDPVELVFGYTQQMMAFLLFIHQPQHILMLGLGGGSLAKYCYRYLPAAHITALELDPQVLSFRALFMLPPDDERFRIVNADAAQYLQTPRVKSDVVMIDAFDRHGFSASVCSRNFYLDVRETLSPQGAMVGNMVGPKSERAAHLETIADVFAGNLIVLPIEADGNYLVFAFRDPAFEPRWRWIEGQMKAMQTRYGLDFPSFAGKLKRSRKAGYLQSLMLQAEA